MQTRRLPRFCQSKNCTRKNYTCKEDFIQDYCSREERLNSTLLKEKSGEFLSAEVSWWESTGEC